MTELERLTSEAEQAVMRESRAAMRRHDMRDASTADDSMAALFEEFKPVEGEMPIELFINRRAQRLVHHEKHVIHHQEKYGGGEL